MQWCKPFLLFVNVSFFIYIPLFFFLSILSSISTLLSPLNQSNLLFVFLRNIPFCTFSFFLRRLKTKYCSNQCHTHAVCKKLEFKRVLTLSLRMTDTCHVLISVVEPCKRMSLFCCIGFYKAIYR